MILNCAGQTLDLTHPQVMGILNVTPDSFSDGGQFFAPDRALAQAIKMVEDGAGIIDIGGESTRPGAKIVSVDDEIARVVPIIEAIHSEINIPISIDTSKPEVMQAALNSGAGFINDVKALQVDGALEVAVEYDVPVCLMHAQGTAQTMQNDPHYDDVVSEVNQFLLDRVQVCQQVGIARERLLLDPGFGFGKRARHNLSLMKSLSTLVQQGLPVLVGVSRKSMIGALLNVSVEERLAASLSLAALSIWQGAKIIRSHDVRETVQAIMMCDHVMKVSDFDE